MTIFLLGYALLINLISGLLMYIDKQRAIKNQWRIAESSLLFCCLLGGFMGTYLAMKFARHKTKHWQFHLTVIVSTLFWLAGLPMIIHIYAFR